MASMLSCYFPSRDRDPSSANGGLYERVSLRQLQYGYKATAEVIPRLGTSSGTLVAAS